MDTRENVRPIVKCERAREEKRKTDRGHERNRVRERERGCGESDKYKEN